MSLDVAVLGGGHGALATAGDLAHRGFRVHLALRNRRRFSELFRTGLIQVSGAGVQAVAEMASVTQDHRAAAAGADVVLVPVPATAQEAIATGVAGSVRDGALVVLMPGNLGSPVARRHLTSAVLAETATLPYGARQRGEAEVQLAMVARHNPTGVHPRRDTAAGIKLLKRLYTSIEPVEDVLSAALLNSNGALHAPLVFLNASPIERLGAYDIHVEGTTAGAKRVIAALDAERIALREALGYGAPHWPLMDYYQDRDWFYGPRAFSRVQRDSVWREKIDFSHRYVAEDVGCGLCLWSSLGRALGVPTPLADAFAGIASAFTGVDWCAAGRTLDSLSMTLDELRAWL